MAGEVPTMSLKTGNIQMAQPKFLEYQWTPENLQLMQTSLANLDARKLALKQEKSKVDVALGQLETQMNEKDLPWFNAYKQKIEDDINYQAEVGNYGMTTGVAIEAAGKTAKDTLIQNRIKSNAKFEEFNKKLEDLQTKGEISKDTREMLESKNAYSYEAKYNEHGIELPGDIWKPIRQPVRDLNLANISDTAFKLITPFKTKRSDSRSDDSNIDKDGNVLDVRTGSGSSHSFIEEKVDIKDIKAVMKTLLQTLPDGLSSVEQAFDTYKYKTEKMEAQLQTLNPESEDYKNLQEQINRRKWLYERNGVDEYDNDGNINYEEFFARLLADELYQKQRAYDWRFTEDTVQNSSIGSKSTTKEEEEEEYVEIFPNIKVRKSKQDSGRGHNIVITEENDTKTKAKEAGSRITGLATKKG